MFWYFIELKLNTSPQTDFVVNSIILIGMPNQTAINTIIIEKLTMRNTNNTKERINQRLYTCICDAKILYGKKIWFLTILLLFCLVEISVAIKFATIAIEIKCFRDFCFVLLYNVCALCETVFRIHADLSFVSFV